MRIGQIITSLVQIATRDHDLLSGLADDDHPQYNKDTRPWSGVCKTADEIVSSSTVLQNDDHLFRALAANNYYLVILALNGLDGALSSGFRFALTVPAGASVVYGAFCSLKLGTPAVLKAANSSGEAILIQSAQASDTYVTLLVALVTTVAQAGNVQLQWAQAVQGAGNTTLKAGSHMLVYTLG